MIYIVDGRVAKEFQLEVYGFVPVADSWATGTNLPKP